METNDKKIGLEKVNPTCLETEYKNIDELLQMNSCNLFQSRTHKISDILKKYQNLHANIQFTY